MNIKSLLFQASTLLILALGCFACSSDKSNLYDYVSSDNMTIVSANLHDVFDNAGFEITPEGVVLTESFKKIMSGSTKSEFVEFASIGGVNYEQFIIEKKGKGEEDVVVVFALDDRDMFASCLKDKGYELSKSADMEIFALSEDCSVIIDGDCGVLLNCGKEKAAQVVLNLKKAAEEKPLTSWQQEVLASSKTFAMVVDLKAAYDISQKTVGDKLGMSPSSDSDENSGENGYLVFTSSLSSVEWNGEAHVCNTDGEEIKFEIETYPLATSLLRYVNDRDCAVALFSMPMGLDFGALFNIFAGGGMIGQFKKILETIQSVMIAGYPSDLQNAADASSWNGVIAAELEPGAAQKFMRLAKIFGGGFGATGNGGVSLSYTGMQINLSVDGDNIIITVNEHADTDGISHIKDSDFGDGFGGIVIDVPEDSPVAKSLSMPFGVNFKISADSDGAVTSLVLSGTDGGLLENVIDFIASKQ